MNTRRVKDINTHVMAKSKACDSWFSRLIAQNSTFDAAKRNASSIPVKVVATMAYAINQCEEIATGELASGETALIANEISKAEHSISDFQNALLTAKQEVATSMTQYTTLLREKPLSCDAEEVFLSRDMIEDKDLEARKIKNMKWNEYLHSTILQQFNSWKHAASSSSPNFRAIGQNVKNSILPFLESDRVTIDREVSRLSLQLQVKVLPELQHVVDVASNVQRSRTDATLAQLQKALDDMLPKLQSIGADFGAKNLPELQAKFSRWYFAHDFFHDHHIYDNAAADFDREITSLIGREREVEHDVINFDLGIEEIEHGDTAVVQQLLETGDSREIQEGLERLRKGLTAAKVRLGSSSSSAPAALVSVKAHHRSEHVFTQILHQVARDIAGDDDVGPAKSMHKKHPAAHKPAHKHSSVEGGRSKSPKSHKRTSSKPAKPGKRGRSRSRSRGHAGKGKGRAGLAGGFAPPLTATEVLGGGSAAAPSAPVAGGSKKMRAASPRRSSPRLATARSHIGK
jgi:hypothetical protein